MFYALYPHFILDVLTTAASIVTMLVVSYIAVNLK
jgi:hypothetical protein